MSTTRLHSAALTAVALVLALAQRVVLLVRFACILMVHPASTRTALLSPHHYAMNATSGSHHKYQPPPWVAKHLDATAYNNWLRGKAQGLCRLDYDCWGSSTISEAKAADHAAMGACNGFDHRTGEPLR